MTTTQSNWLKAIYDRMVNVPKFTMEEFFYQCNGGQSYIKFDTKEYEKLTIGSRSNTVATLTVLGNGSTAITASNGIYNVSAYDTVTVRLNNSSYTSGYLYNIELY